MREWLPVLREFTALVTELRGLVNSANGMQKETEDDGSVEEIALGDDFLYRYHRSRQ